MLLSRVVTENVIAPTAQKVQDGTLLNDVSKGFWDTTEIVCNKNWLEICLSFSFDYILECYCWLSFDFRLLLS